MKLGVHPCWFTGPSTYSPAKPMQQCKHRDAKDDGDYGVAGKCPCEAYILDPNSDKEGVDEGRHVEHDSIEDDNGHALLGVGIDNIRTHGGISHLNACTD